MTEERSYVKVAGASKGIKKTKFPVDVDAERRFDALKRKYANAVAFLLVSNIPRL